MIGRWASREMPDRRCIVSLAVVVTIIVASVTSPAAALAWTTFTHPEFAFSLSYPADWTVANGVSGVAFMVVGPEAAGLPGMRLNVNVTHDSLPAGTSLDTYHTQSESAIKAIFSGFRSLQTDHIKIGNLPAVLRQYTWRTNNGVDIYQLQLVVVNGTHGYVVTGTTGAGSARLVDEVKLLGTILGTFRPE